MVRRQENNYYEIQAGRSLEWCGGVCCQGGALRKLPETHDILFHGLKSGGLGFYFYYCSLIVHICGHRLFSTYSVFHNKKQVYSTPIF